MRKLILLSFVFVLTMGVFAQKEADAVFATTAWQELVREAVKDNTSTLQTEISERFEKLYLELRNMSGQNSTVGTANTMASIRASGNSNQSRAITAQQGLQAGALTTYVNAGGQNCVLASGGKGNAVVSEGADNTTEQLIVERMRNVNSEAGTDAENGLVDFRIKMFERSRALCDPSGNGGANTFCNGSGNGHITLATILTPLAFQNQSPLTERLDYLQDLLFARIPVSVNPDLLEDPDTKAMNMVVESDRIKAEMSVGQTLFSILQGNRTKIATTAADTLKERLIAGGWSEEKIDNLTAGGISKNSMYHALTTGSFSSEMLLQKASANGRDLNANILGELALNNVLQFEQYKLLEAIALATATNIVVNRDDAIKDLNARISAANNGN